MDSMLFYGGIVLAVCSLVGAVFSFIVYKVSTSKLGRMLDTEYGPRRPKKIMDEKGE